MSIRTRLSLPVIVGVGVVTAGQASAALAAAVKPSVPPGYKITQLAVAPKGATNCDDLAFLDGHLYMGCQNKTLSIGGGGESTLAEYTLSGSLVKTWMVKDKIDGIGGDPVSGRLIVTENEDGNSHLFTVTPSTGQITNYAYSPNPRSASAPVALHTGGGTDNVSVDSAGHILITGSHAGTRTGTAVFKVTLTPPSSPSATGTAALSPTFLDDATAANGNTGSGTVKLALGDVDSGTIVPQDSPRFGGSYVIDDQTALELVFAGNIFNGTGLTVLKTPFGLDDIRWATSDAGTLYVVNNGGTTVGGSGIFKVTGPFKKNTVLAANDGVGDQVVTVDLTNGKLTPLVRHLTTTKGLVYLNPDGSETALALAGSTTAPTTSTTSTTATGTSSAPASTPTSTSRKGGGSSNTGLIVGIIIAVVLIAGGGGYWMMRRGRS